MFEAVSTAWEVDLWPKWDTTPWIDGGQVTDIDATKHQALRAGTLGSLPSVVVSQGSYDDEGIPAWAAPRFARQQARLAALGTNVIHLRADGVGHFIHDKNPTIITSAVAAVVDAVRTDQRLPLCRDIFGLEPGTCLSYLAGATLNLVRAGSPHASLGAGADRADRCPPQGCHGAAGRSPRDPGPRGRRRQHRPAKAEPSPTASYTSKGSRIR